MRVCDKCHEKGVITRHVITYEDKKTGTLIDFCKKCEDEFKEFLKTSPKHLEEAIKQETKKPTKKEARRGKRS